MRVALPMLLSAALLFAPACKRRFPTFEEQQAANKAELAPIVDKHRAASTARFATLEAIGKDAKAAPPVASEAFATVKVTAPSSGDLSASGVMIVGAQTLIAPGIDSAPVHVKCEVPLSRLQDALVLGKSSPGDPVSYIDQQFALFESIAYVVVVRVRSYVPPKSVRTNGEDRFESGTATGDVIVYELSSGHRVGAFPFQARQSGTAKVSAHDTDKELAESFEVDFGTALRNELAAFASGKAGPIAPGAADATSNDAFAKKIDTDLTLAYIGAGVASVDVGNDASGACLVTIHAKTPKQLRKLGSTDANADVQAKVTKTLGSACAVTVMESGTHL